MHEMGIAYEVVAAVQREAERRSGKVPQRIGVRIGEMAAVDPQALLFCYEAITRDTGLHAVQLEIQVCPFRFRCLSCGREFVVRNYETQCPQCASAQTECIGGQELELAYLEVEDHGASCAGAKSPE